MKFFYLTYIFVLLVTLGCTEKHHNYNSSIPILDEGAYPYVIYHDDTYYFTMQSTMADTIELHAVKELQHLTNNTGKIIWTSTQCGMYHIWSPELHRINNSWYIYFELDNGNTDNHQLYVLENPSNDPMEGEWTLHGPIITDLDCNFGIHPTSVIVGSRQYILWSGWQKQRTETETQCIFIAEMENPWTLKSERVLISKPELEWERQWINPDGSRSAYPIFVNENPQAYVSPNEKNIIVTYSASGIWTAFNSLGMLYAPIGSDLLDPKSWTKSTEPLFVNKLNNDIFGTSNISIVTTDKPDNTYMLFQAKRYEHEYIVSGIRMKQIKWNADELPIFGQP